MTKDLSPARLEVLEPTEKTFTLRIVSERFREMPPLSRFQLLCDLFEDRVPDFAKDYLFDFEAWTAAEFASLDRDGEGSETSAAPSRSRIAARGADL